MKKSELNKLNRRRDRLLVDLINSDELRLDREWIDDTVYQTELHKNSLSWIPQEFKQQQMQKEILNDLRKTVMAAINANQSLN